MKLLKENAILANLRENEKPVGGMTLAEVADNLYGGEIDVDVSDVDIDMVVAFVYNTQNEPDDEYDRFIKILADRTKVVKLNNSSWGDTLVCDFSSVFKPYNEELMNVFDMNNSEFDDSEAYYEAVLNLEGLIPGMAGESTYRELNDILEGKVGKLNTVNELNHKRIEESSTEEYWDAKEIKRDGFVCLLKFNSGDNKYIITNDNNEVKRFSAASDDEAIKQYEKWRTVPRDAFGEYVLDESADSKITTPDLNNGVTLKCKIGGKEHTIYASWDDNFDFDEEVKGGTIPEGSKPEDWGGIIFEVNATGEEYTDGGELVTDKDEFTVSELGSDLLGLLGNTGTDFELVSEAPAEEKKEEPTGEIVTVEDLDNEGNNFIFRGDAGNGDERLLINFALSSEGGIDYTIYREGGAEVDGGVMDVDADKTWNSLKAVAEELASFQGIKNTNSFIACDEGSADEALPQYGFIKESVKGKKSLGTVIKEAAKINNKAKGLIKEAEEERSWLKDKNKYEGFKKFVDKQLRDGAIDDPEYVNSLSDKEYEDLLTLTWMKDKDMLDMYEERLDEEVTESEPESATKTNKPNKVRNYLNYELEDDDTETGGVAFNGETVEDFIRDADIKEDDDLDKLNKALVSCGIRPIAEGYESSYRGDDYWDLSDAYENGELTDRELAWELIKMYDNYSAVEKTFYEITGKKEVPEMGPDESEVKEITPDEANQYIMEWENNRESVKRGRFITQDGDKFIGIDNRTGDCWVEEFNNKGSVIDWLEDRIEADGTIIESAESTKSADEALQELVNKGTLIDFSSKKNDDGTVNYTLVYEIPMIVDSTERALEADNDSLEALVAAVKLSAETVGDDIYGSLVDENDFYGHGSKEEMEKRIDAEEAVLKNIALDLERKPNGMKEAISDPVDLMCGFIGDLFNNMSEGFKANSESLYDWCEGGDAFRNAGFDEDTCRMLDKMLEEINPLVQNINQTLYAIAGELDESVDEKGNFTAAYSINDGEYVLSILQKASEGGEVDLLVKAKDGKGSSAILPGYDQIEGFEFTKDDEPFYSGATFSDEDVINLLRKFKPDYDIKSVNRIPNKEVYKGI